MAKRAAAVIILIISTTTRRAASSFTPGSLGVGLGHASSCRREEIQEHPPRRKRAELPVYRHVAGPVAVGRRREGGREGVEEGLDGGGGGESEGVEGVD